MNTYLDGFSKAPPEILENIFFYLPPTPLKQAAAVCTSWRETAASNRLWKETAVKYDVTEFSPEEDDSCYHETLEKVITYANAYSSHPFLGDEKDMFEAATRVHEEEGELKQRILDRALFNAIITKKSQKEVLTLLQCGAKPSPNAVKEALKYPSKQLVEIIDPLLSAANTHNRAPAKKRNTKCTAFNIVRHSCLKQPKALHNTVQKSYETLLPKNDISLPELLSQALIQKADIEVIRKIIQFGAQPNTDALKTAKKHASKEVVSLIKSAITSNQKIEKEAKKQGKS